MHSLAEILVLAGGSILPAPVPFCTRVSARMKRVLDHVSPVHMQLHTPKLAGKLEGFALLYMHRSGGLTHMPNAGLGGQAGHGVVWSAAEEARTERGRIR